MEKQHGDGIVGDLTLSAFRILANGVRKFIKGSRPLEDGELHFLGANFMGPGTKIQKYKNRKPLNKPDAVARQHDLDYYQAINKKDISEKERKEMIRKADNKMIRALKDMGEQEGTAELYRQAGLKGIQFKRKVENVSPALVKMLLPEDIVGQKKEKKEKKQKKEQKPEKVSPKDVVPKDNKISRENQKAETVKDVVPKDGKISRENQKPQTAGADSLPEQGFEVGPQATGRAGNPIFAQFSKINFPVRRDFQLQSGGSMHDKIVAMRKFRKK